MGLLSKFKSSTPAKRASDDVLLLHSIICMCAADGMIEDAEHEMIRNYANTLPEFRDMDAHQFSQCVQGSAKIAQQFNRDMKSSLQALGEIQSEAVRKKAFVLAIDVALSSGDIDESEEEMIEAMQRILRIDDSLAQQAIEVISLKYLR